MPLHTLAKAFAPLATNVWMQLARKALAQKSVLVTQHHTVVKTSVKFAVSVQTKTVLKQFAQINAKVTFHHMLVKTCAQFVENAPTKIALRPFAPTSAMDIKKLAKSNCNLLAQVSKVSTPSGYQWAMPPTTSTATAIL